jgi:hypothetical protein
MEWVWLDYGPSKLLEGSRPHRAADSETVSIKITDSVSDTKDPDRFRPRTMVVLSGRYTS